ncbi:MAG: ASCH domain-containing protein [Planctomycetales bacterium]
MGEARDPNRPALGIQQPWVELILRGIKTVEIRSQPTQIRGTIYLYASKRDSTLECAAESIARHELTPEKFGRGKIVGTVELWNCRLATKKDAEAACVSSDLLTACHAWELRHPKRFAEPLEVTFLPYGVWFYPWRRKNQGEA